MTDIDTRLREQAERWREAHAELGTPTIPPLPAGRALRPRALLAVAASVAAVALVAAGLAAYAHSHRNSVQPDAGNATVHVPWSAVGQVPDSSYHFAAAPPGAPASMPACTASDLRVLSVHTAPDSRTGLAGWVETTIVVRSSANSRCSVPHGGFSATLVSADGTQLPVDGSGFDPVGPYIPPPTRQIVSPGDEVFVTAMWAVDTTRMPRPNRVILWLGPQSSRTDPVTIPLGNVTIPPHPTVTGNPSWRSAASANVNNVASAGSIASLTPSVRVPSSVPAGAVLRYTVTLSNTTDVAVSLRPCPTVAQHVDVKGARPVQSAGTIGPLNCAAAPRDIAPGDSVVLDYEVTLPANLTGFALLSWSVIGGPDVLLSAGGYATVN